MITLFMALLTIMSCWQMTGFELYLVGGPIKYQQPQQQTIYNTKEDICDRPLDYIYWQRQQERHSGIPGYLINTLLKGHFILFAMHYIWLNNIFHIMTFFSDIFTGNYELSDKQLVKIPSVEVTDIYHNVVACSTEQVKVFIGKTNDSPMTIRETLAQPTF